MKKNLSLIISLVLIIGVMPQNIPAADGPCQEDYPPAYISLVDDEAGTIPLFSNYIGDNVQKVDGIEYDKSDNTLTLNNVKQNKTLVTNVMGDDFKIKLKGNNELNGILVWGDEYGGNLTITGDGKLVINKNKSQKSSIVMYAEKTQGLLKIEKSARVDMYASKGNPVIDTLWSTNSVTADAIVIEGKTSSEVKVESRQAEVNDIITSKAMSVDSRCYLYKFKKDGKNYGGQEKYDSNGESTGEYIMFEVINDETYGNIGVPVNNLKKIIPADYGYEKVMVDSEQQDEYRNVLIFDNWTYTYQMYHSTEKDKDYGVQNIHYTNGDTGKEEDYYAVYDIVKYGNYGYIAVPVEGMEKLDKLPADFKELLTDPYTLYYYTVGLEKLFINSQGENDTEPTTKGDNPTTKADNPTTKANDQTKAALEKKPERITGIKAAKAKKKTVSITWKKVANASKYQIQYSLSKKFKKAKKFRAKTVTTSKNKYTIKKLIKKKTYYVRIRAINNKTVGQWSKIKKIKVTK